MNGKILSVEWGLHQLNDEFSDGNGTLFLLEKVNQTLATVLDGRGASMRSQFLFDFPDPSFTLWNVKFQELDVVRDGS
jgi:hypothetical protein